MTSHERRKTFLSYAHKDGAEIAQRLFKDLASNGHEPWVDDERIKGGSNWSRAIEKALDEADVVLVILTEGSYRSEVCRAEQLRSLRKGKQVIPLLGQRHAERPLYLEAQQYLDFSKLQNYEDEFHRLLSAIAGKEGARLIDSYRQTYVTAPPMPANFVKRPEALASLRDALIRDDGPDRSIALLAVQGMGGIGKTVLAQALCHDEVVQQAFPDGVIWVTMGKESAFSPVERFREVGKALNDDLTRYDNELGCRNQYRSTIRSKAALIVIDDVWTPSQIEPFRAESPRSRLLFTTRDASIAAALGAQELWAEVLSESQAREVFARWVGVPSDHLSNEGEEIIRECRQLPLALAMAGAMLRGKPPDLWKRMLELFKTADLAKVRAQFPDYPHPSLFVAIEASVRALPPQEQQRYRALAVLLEEMPVPRPIQQTLWGVSATLAAETAEKLFDLSLAQRDLDGESIRLHDLQLDYIRSQYEDQEALGLIHGAVRLSTHVILRDPAQFRAQLLGRLVGSEAPAIQELLGRAAQNEGTAWLRPVNRSLIAPGGPLLRTFEGHNSTVNTVAITADGSEAISASNDNTLKVWELKTGKLLHTLSGHSREVRAVAITGDGTKAVSVSADNTLKVWELKTGKLLHTLDGHSREVQAVVISGDGTQVVSASRDKTLKVWELLTGKLLHTLDGHSREVRAIAITPDGTQGVSASRDKTLKVWELKTGSLLYTLKGHSLGIKAAAVTSDGTRAVSASSDRTLKVWELKTGKLLHTLEGHSLVVQAVAITSDGALAVSCSDDKMLIVWDLKTGKPVHMLRGHSDVVRAVAVTNDGTYAVSGSDDKTLKVWELETGKLLQTLEGHSGAVWDVAITSDGAQVVSASRDRTLKAWQLTRGRLDRQESHGGDVQAVAVTSDGAQAVSASRDKTLKVWELKTGRLLHTLEGHSGGVWAVAIARNGIQVVSVSWDKTLRIWELKTGRIQHTLEGHRGGVWAIAITSDSARAISGSDDKTLRVWELKTGKLVHTLKGHRGGVRAVAVTSDGAYATSGSDDRTLKVWDLKTGKLVHTLKGHSGGIWAMAITSDNARLVSASADTTVRVWDLKTGKLLHTLKGHSGGIRAVAIAGDGEQMVSASADKTLGVWELKTGELVHTLEGHARGVEAVAILGDGAQAVSASADKALKVWDLQTGHVVDTFSADGNMWSCTATPDGEDIVGGDSLGRVHILHLQQPKRP